MAQPDWDDLRRSLLGLADQIVCHLENMNKHAIVPPGELVFAADLFEDDMAAFELRLWRFLGPVLAEKERKADGRTPSHTGPDHPASDAGDGRGGGE